ncbi:MAG: hypothetical protein FJX57_05480, partial [Alphaproteobacteria bacterium]|nr:hypothetical protein [Alphaproteobacteria bacterium]
MSASTRPGRGPGSRRCRATLPNVSPIATPRPCSGISIRRRRSDQAACRRCLAGGIRAGNRLRTTGGVGAIRIQPLSPRACDESRDDRAGSVLRRPPRSLREGGRAPDRGAAHRCAYARPPARHELRAASRSGRARCLSRRGTPVPHARALGVHRRAARWRLERARDFGAARAVIAAAAALLAALVAWPSNAQAQRLLDFTEEERASVARHGPWPPDFERDPSNRVSGDPAAIELGRLLFFAPLLSVDGRIACATCHRADRGWTDGERTSTGLARGVRNAIGLANQRLNRWFGWDGANDSLWAQSLRPLLDPSEMGSTPAAVAAHLRREPELRCHYRAAFGNEPGADDEVILVDAAKALAAFQETIVSARTPFDRFRDSLQRGDAPDAANYPMEAQRGL